MFKIAIVVFRECLEVAILLSIIIASTANIPNRVIYIVAGLMMGCVSAALLAFFTNNLAFACGGIGSELFDVGIMLLTVVVIGWTVFWMQGYSANIRNEVSAVARNIESGNLHKLTLTSIVAITMFREVAEIVLFIYSISSASSISSTDYLLGLGLGFAGGISVGIAIYCGLLRWAGKYIFNICSIMLIFIAAGIAAEAAGILTSIGAVTVLTQSIWDSTWLVRDGSIMGKLLKILIGYEAKPNILQLLFYVGTIVALFCLTKKSILCKLLKKR